MSTSLLIGKFELKIITVPEGDEAPFHDELHVWIQHENGEGMSTRLSNIEDLIARFYLENF
jgi:hypothetical protein